MNSQRFVRIVLVMVIMGVMLISGLVSHAQDPVTIEYVLWDANQLPAYQECATAFTAQNPNIEIEIVQQGWDDYWTGITTGFISGDAPDVFTNHLAKYPEFVELEQLVDIQPLVERDGVATDIYYPGLADLWTRDGARYGLPKDWDTVAIIYNAEMVEAAGIDPASLNELTWNPEDGGTFEEVIAMLTLDANGNNGLSPDFDRENVVQWGFVHDGMGGAYGQTQWSAFAVSNGFTFNNGVWGDEYYYDDPALADTIEWYTGLWLDKGYAPTVEEQSGLGQVAIFQNQQAALAMNGSWMIGTFLGSDFEVGFSALPEGPNGSKSMFNGLADSIWVGTDHLEESWEWVKFLASADCQNIVGESGVVFPAIPESTDISLQVRADAGVDVSAFTNQAQLEGGTFLFPIADYAGEITTIMSEAMDSVGLGQMNATDALGAANEEVNSLFE